MSTYRTGLLIFSLALFVFSIPLSGQSAAQQEGAEIPDSQTLFREFLEVNVVNLEVIVSDKNGNPVLDLTAKDFEIIEDGKKVKLTNFLAPGGSAGTGSIGKKIAVGTQRSSSSERAEKPSREPNTERASLVVLIDSLNSEPHERARVVDDLREFFSGYEDSVVQVMIASYDGGVTVLQNPTSDWGLVEKALT